MNKKVIYIVGIIVFLFSLFFLLNFKFKWIFRDNFINKIQEKYEDLDYSFVLMSDIDVSEALVTVYDIEYLHNTRAEIYDCYDNNDDFSLDDIRIYIDEDDKLKLDSETDSKKYNVDIDNPKYVYSIDTDNSDCNKEIYVLTEDGSIYYLDLLNLYDETLSTISESFEKIDSNYKYSELGIFKGDWYSEAYRILVGKTAENEMIIIENEMKVNDYMPYFSTVITNSDYGDGALDIKGFYINNDRTMYSINSEEYNKSLEFLTYNGKNILYKTYLDYIYSSNEESYVLLIDTDNNIYKVSEKQDSGALKLFSTKKVHSYGFKENDFFTSYVIIYEDGNYSKIN